MPVSAEVRWFFANALPGEVGRWFARGGSASTAVPREDHYLLFPSSLGLNVKLREGRLEVKSLVKTLGVRTFTTAAAGNVQLWEKRFGGDAALREFENLRSTASHLWIAIRKERTLRTFSPDGDSLIEIPAGRVFLSEGCNVELTTIQVEGSAYWSFAIEAFGASNRVEQHLRHVAGIVLADEHNPPHPFPASDSCSYPEWIERFSKKA